MKKLFFIFALMANPIFVFSGELSLHCRRGKYKVSGTEIYYDNQKSAEKDVVKYKQIEIEGLLKWDRAWSRFSKTTKQLRTARQSLRQLKFTPASQSSVVLERQLLQLKLAESLAKQAGFEFESHLKELSDNHEMWAHALLAVECFKALKAEAEKEQNNLTLSP